MNIIYWKDKTEEITKERAAAIKEYLKLCKQFTILRTQWICTHIVINKVQIETDIDLVTKDMSEEEIKKLPLIEQEYLQFLILPYASFEWWSGKERCLDNFDTETIKLINERIAIKVNTYKEFLKSE